MRTSKFLAGIEGNLLQRHPVDTEFIRLFFGYSEQTVQINRETARWQAAVVRALPLGTTALASAVHYLFAATTDEQSGMFWSSMSVPKTDGSLHLAGVTEMHRAEIHIDGFVAVSVNRFAIMQCEPRYD